MIIRTNTTEESLHPLTHSTLPYISRQCRYGAKTLVIMLSMVKYINLSDCTQVNSEMILKWLCVIIAVLIEKLFKHFSSTLITKCIQCAINQCYDSY